MPRDDEVREGGGKEGVEPSVVVNFRVPSTSICFETPLFPENVESGHLDRLFVVAETAVTQVSVTSDDADAVAEWLETHPQATLQARFDGVDERCLLVIVWEMELTGFFGCLADEPVAVLGADYGVKEWRFELLFERYADVSSFYQKCMSADVDVSPESVRKFDPSERQDYGVTPRQRETLLMALHEGYFDVPRRTDLDELGKQLGVSDSAVSQRVRRGVKSLVSNTLHSEEYPRNGRA